MGLMFGRVLLAVWAVAFSAVLVRHFRLCRRQKAARYYRGGPLDGRRVPPDQLEALRTIGPEVTITSHVATHIGGREQIIATGYYANLCGDGDLWAVEAPE